MADFTPRQLIVLALMLEECKPLQVPYDLCPHASMLSLERRGLVRGSRNGYRITKQGRKVMQG